MGDSMRAGKSCWYRRNQPGQLSLRFFWAGELSSGQTSLSGWGKAGHVYLHQVAVNSV